MRRLTLDKIEKGAVHFFDEYSTCYVESASDIIKNGLIEFFSDEAAAEITQSSLFADGLVSMRLTTGAIWVPSQRLTYFPIVSFVIMAAALLSCTLANVKVPFFSYSVSACCLLLPLIFIFSDVINELYGYRMTRNVIQATAAGLVFLGVISHITLEGLSANTESIYTSRSEFDLIVGRIYAYMYLGAAVLLLSDTFNAWLFRYMKSITHGRSLWLRSFVSNATAQSGYCALFALGYYTLPIFADDVVLTQSQPIDFLYNYTAIMFGVLVLMPLLYAMVFIIRRLDTRNLPAH